MNRLHRAALVIGVLAGIALVLSSFAPAMAGGRVFVGVGIGFPFYSPWVYPFPYPAYPFPLYSPPVVVQAAPQTFVQQPEAPPPAPAPQYWYYCPTSQSFYPYVNECPAGWVQVPPEPSAPPAAPR